MLYLSNAPLKLVNVKLESTVILEISFLSRLNLVQEET